MLVVTVSEPEVEPISVAEALRELRTDPAEVDDLARRLSRARQAIEQWTGHRLISQVAVVSGVPVVDGVAVLPIVPVQALEAVLSPSGIDAGDLVVETRGWISGFPPGVTSASVRVRVGYGDTGVSVPGDFLAAILQLCGQWGEWREAVAGGLPGQGVAPPSELPHSVSAIVADRRVVRL